MNVLLISPFPPARDGLANYAVQVAADLRAGGDTVEILSPQPSAARRNQPVKTLPGILKAAVVGRRADKVVVQFHPEIFFTGMEPARFARGWLGLYLLFSICANVEVVVHETAYSEAGRTGALRMRMWGILWRKPRKVLVHTETERGLMISAFSVGGEALGVLDHGASFRRRTAATREEARRDLGLPDGTHVFLCAGFLQPHKGFDRAAAALGRLRGPAVRLDIVGEMRVWTPEHDDYVRLLARQADADSRVHLHDGYVSDELFDRWIVACDTVVLPYREIWSSGVAERAALYGRPVIVTDVGGLAEQIDEGTVVHDAEALVAAMAESSGAEVAPSGYELSDLTSAAGVQNHIARRARSLKEWFDPLDRKERNALDVQAGDPRRGPLVLPVARPGAHPKAVMQRVVRRVTGWQLDAVTRYVNALRDELLGGHGDGDGDGPGPGDIPETG